MHSALAESSGLEPLSADVVDSAENALSYWSKSKSKRVFDLACVIFAIPFVMPILVIVGLAVRLTSRGPALFRQKRYGLCGSTFTIFKFRTMKHQVFQEDTSLSKNQAFTSIGPFLRKWKLDELPQLLNVLLGDMSLVGPRPKLPEHQFGKLLCRPGITGAATLVFANEETVLSYLPSDMRSEYVQTTVLPAKFRLDMQYMANATFISDLELVLRTLMRTWDRDAISQLLALDKIEGQRVPCQKLEYAVEDCVSGD